MSFKSEGKKGQLIWSGALTSNPSDRGAQTELLALDGSARGAGSYTLELDDGGDAPLTALTLERVVGDPLSRVRSLLSAPRTDTRLPNAQSPERSDFCVNMVHSIVFELGETEPWLWGIALLAGIPFVAWSVQNLIRKRLGLAPQRVTPPDDRPPGAPPWP